MGCYGLFQGSKDIGGHKSGVHYKKCFPQARLFQFYFHDSIAPLLSPQLLIEYIEENHINSDEFLMNVPVGMQLLVEADKARIATNGKDKMHQNRDIIIF